MLSKLYVFSLFFQILFPYVKAVVVLFSLSFSFHFHFNKNKTTTKIMFFTVYGVDS